jgi:hypothetical protein
MMLTTIALAIALSQATATSSPPSAKAVQASATATAQIRFSFEHPQLDPGSYTLLIRQDGSGHYQSVARSTGGLDASGGIDPSPIASTSISRDIEIRDPLLSAFFQSARSHQFFAIECEAAGNHVAFTGKKTVSYTGPDGRGECTYNWSHDQQLNQLADDLMAVAYTIEEGRRLALEHVHSRLSLDAELDALQDAAKDRRALELENISSELTSIANDEAVMKRARNRARALLNGGGSRH